MIVTDAGYDITRLAFVLTDLPVELLGRIRCDRVLRLPKPPRPAGATGRPLKHGPEFALHAPPTWPEPQHVTLNQTTRYGTATATSWDRLHPRLTHRGCWAEHPGELPVIAGTLIRLQVQHLPGDRDPKPVWLWSSTVDATAVEVDRWWQSFLRRFDLEHTFRLFKQTLGWTAPRIRNPTSGDRWTWLIIAAHSTAPRSPPRRGPPPTLGEARCTRPADTGSGPPRVFGTSARTPRPRPAHRNLPDPAPAAHLAQRTHAALPTILSGKPAERTMPRARRESDGLKIKFRPHHHRRRNNRRHGAVGAGGLEVAVQGGSADPQHVGDLRERGASGDHLGGLLRLGRRHDGGPAPDPTPPAGGGEPGHRPFPDQVTLELRQRPKMWNTNGPPGVVVSIDSCNDRAQD